MSAVILQVENMVCPRCVLMVENVCKSLGIEVDKVELGSITIDQAISVLQKQKLNQELEQIGLKLIESDKQSLINAIKTAIITQIHHTDKALHVNFSDYLAEKLHYEYSYLSRLFSASEHITIEKYIALQKIEKAKELLSLSKYRISEIAHQLHYKSISHFSVQFKEITGQTPSQYKKKPLQARNTIDFLKLINSKD